MTGTVIKGGQVCSTSVAGRYDIRLESGRIAAVAPSIRLEPGDRTIDAAGMTVIPGLIDVHVHFRDPGSPERESFLTGTAAAAANGVTTVLEMPTADVPITTAERLLSRARHLVGRSYIDFGLYGGAGRDSLNDVAACAKAGAIAFKTFTHRPNPSRADAFAGLWAVDEPDLLETMRAVASTGRVHAVHCENDALLEHFADQDRPDDPFGLRHRGARPAVVEESAIALVAGLSLETRSRVHLVHVSTDRAAGIADAVRRVGADLSIETCPHYLILDDRTLDRLGSYAKCNPPLRPEGTRDRLVAQLRSGLVDIIASDHCSYTTEELEQHADDPCHALPGLPGIEFLLPSLLRIAADGGIELRSVLASMTSAPAQRFGLTGKGDIVVGHDADLVVVDPSAAVSFDVDAPFHAMGSRNAVYLEAVELRGRAVTTLVRGEPVVVDGELVGSPSHGRWIRGN